MAKKKHHGLKADTHHRDGSHARPHHVVHHGHEPQRHGTVPRSHTHGPATQDFHFNAEQERAMRQGNEGLGAPHARGMDSDGDYDGD